MVFIGGLHRSGTTPLSRVLAEHPSMSGLRKTGVTADEGQHLQSVYPPASNFGGPGRFALSPGAHLTERSALATSESAQRLWADWMPFWDPTRELLLEKSPPNVIMGRFLQAVFPGSALIVVLRHPVVVSLSTVKWRRLASRRWWRHTSVHTMVRHWFAAHELLREDAPHLARLHVVKYEELLSDPQEQLAGIQQFLGLDEPFRTDLLRGGHSQQYEDRWDAMTKGVVASAHRKRIERDYAELAASFGYDISDVRALKSWSLTDRPGPL